MSLRPVWDTEQDPVSKKDKLMKAFCIFLFDCLIFV